MVNFFNKKNGIKILLTSFLLSLLLLPHYAFAGWFDSPVETILAGIATAITNSLLPVIVAVTLVLQTLAALFLGLAGFLFGSVIDYSVLGMKSLVDKMVFIDTAWTTFRDLANIFFIFILLYIAIGTILNLSGINTKKMLVSVVITAIFLNFSLFFTKIAIDASNLLAISIHNSIVGPDSWNIGTLLVGQMGLETFYTLFSAETLVNPTKTIITQVGSAAFMFIAAFVIFSVALFFIIRFVVLIFLMILSPLAFAAMALPKDEYSKKWKETLISQCIFAPLCMAFLWITVNTSSELVKMADTGASLSDLFNPELNPVTNPGGSLEQAMIMLFNFIALIAMLIFSLVVSKSFASKGAGQMMKMAEWAQGKAGRAMVRGTGVAYLDRKFADSQFGKSVIGRNIRAVTTGAATSFDGFGDKKSVQKVDKEVKKLNEDYGKKAREEAEKAHLKKYRESLLNDRKLNEETGEWEDSLKAKAAKHEKTLKDTEPDLKAAEERLRTEAAAGNVFGIETLKEEEGRLANMKANYNTMSNNDGGQKDRAIDELEEKIKKSKAIHDEVSKHRNTIEESTNALAGTKNRNGERKGGLRNQIKSIERRIEDKAGAETDDEKDSLRTALRAQANVVENSWRTGKGLYKKIPILNKLKIPGITPFIENALSTGDSEELVKAFRKTKGKGFKEIKEVLKNEGVNVDEGGGDEGGGDEGGGKGKDK